MIPRSDVRRVATSTMFGLAGRGGVLLLGLVSVAVTTRYLGPDGYGRFSLALSFVQLFAVLADAGLTTIVVRELAQRPERAAEVLGSALALRCGLAVGASAVAALAAVVMPYPPDVRIAVLIAAVPLTLGLLNSAFVAVLQSDLRAGRAAVGDVLGRAASLAAVAVVAALDLGFYAVVACAGVGAGVTLAVTSLLVRPLLPDRPRPDRSTASSLLRAALPLGAALALNEAYFRADALIISVSRPFEELGVYALAWRVGELTATFPAVFLVSVFPVLARYVATADPRTRDALRAAGDVFVLAGVAVAAGGAAVAGELTRTLGGGGFAGAAAPLRILLAAAAVGFVNGLYGHALIARDRQLAALWLNVFALGLNVALNVALIPPLGILAAAWTALGCEAVILLGSSWLMRRHLDYVPSFAALARALPAAALMIAAVWPLREQPLWLSVPLGAAVYAVAVALLGGIDRDRLRELR
ncbi:MAG TPA: oligosaccharide flippase family protein [Solirubrobacteraceae bacterium]|nr:oligosaccharide flippase family protein [Solirubrobacteraceae bacterium]